MPHTTAMFTSASVQIWFSPQATQKSSKPVSNSEIRRIDLSKPNRRPERKSKAGPKSDRDGMTKVNDML